MSNLLNELPTAQDARTQAIAATLNSKLAKDVTSQIKEAILRGAKKTVLTGALPDDLEKELKSKGYQVIYAEDRGESWTDISWN